MNSFMRWLRSKQGMTVLGIVVALVLVAAILFSQFGRGGTGGTEDMLAQFSAPSGAAQKSCLPTCETDDGKFVVLMGAGNRTLTTGKVTMWVAAPASMGEFNLEVFDGDGGAPGAGGTNFASGNWDTYSGVATYTLYADPDMTGSEANQVAAWASTDMPNNAWWTTTVKQDPRAQNGVDKNYYYMLKVTQDPTGINTNAFKIASNAYLGAGKGDTIGVSLGLRGGLGTQMDVPILYPEFKGDYNNPGPSKYTGVWQFNFFVADGTNRVELWDGDFDRGTSDTMDADGDDANTDATIPTWSSPNVTIAERAGKTGLPADDSGSAMSVRNPAVMYEVYDPQGNLIATNPEPSGTEEWEDFVISTPADPNAATSDVQVGSLAPGKYKVLVKGLDLGNAIWFYTKQMVSTGEVTPVPPPTNVPPTCIPDNYNIGGGATIIALNPDPKCQGQQNGLLFHGTATVNIIGNAYSNGCLRTVGNDPKKDTLSNKIVLTNGQVKYMGEGFGKMDLISPAPVQVTQPIAVNIAAPNCADPAAKQVDGKTWSTGGDVNLDPGLYCVKGDLSINNQQTFKGDGVTIYMMDGKLTINGGANVQLTAPWTIGDMPSVSPALNNILFYVPDLNGDKAAGGQPVSIAGNSNTYMQGVIYAPGSEIEVLGTGQVNAPYRSQFIGWDVRVGGTADVFINWNGYDLPSCYKP